jgi:CoA-transferase family III
MARVLESETLSGALPLSDLRVVECGEGVAAAFATKLMAILGAEVIKVERPAGDVIRERGPFLDDRVDPEQSGLFLYLNADKCGVTLNLSDPGDRARLDRLLASADVLVHNIPLAERAVSGMETRSICASHPHLIVTNISAYGERGPRAHYRAYELNVAHASGAAILAPLNSDRLLRRERSSGAPHRHPVFAGADLQAPADQSVHVSARCDRARLDASGAAGPGADATRVEAPAAGFRRASRRLNGAFLTIRPRLLPVSSIPIEFAQQQGDRPLELVWGSAAVPLLNRPTRGITSTDSTYNCG